MSESSVRNVSFNPMWGSFDRVCVEQGEEGFALVRVIPVTDYQAVGVFERLASERSSEITTTGFSGMDCGICGSRVPPSATHRCKVVGG